MKLFLIISLLLQASLAFPKDYHLEKVKAEKGYILSVDMYEKDCRGIWNRHINIFKKNNPDVEDPDIIAIGEELTVQNCDDNIIATDKKSLEDDTVVIVESNNRIEDLEEEDHRDDFFITISYLNQYTEKKDDDQKKKSEGYKINIGKYFEIGRDRLKLSLGFTEVDTIYYNQEAGVDENRPNAFYFLDSSYLFRFSENFELGPALSAVYQPYDDSTAMKDFENREDDAKTSGLIGANLLYSIDEDWKIDLRLNNRIEDRINLWSSLGIEYNF